MTKKKRNRKALGHPLTSYRKAVYGTGQIQPVVTDQSRPDVVATGWTKSAVKASGWTF